jgi:hypothetical protein
MVLKILAVTVAVVVAWIGAAAAQGSGVQGTVISAPRCPGPAGAPETSDSKCLPQGVQTTVDVFTDLDSTAAAKPEVSVVTDASGRFRVPLAPGHYRLVPRALSAVALGRPETVEVTGRGFAEITLTVDTGLR